MLKTRNKYGIKEILFILLVCFELGHFGNTVAEYSILLLMFLCLAIDLIKKRKLKYDRFVKNYLLYMIVFGIYAGFSYFWSENKTAFLDAFPPVIKCLFISFWLLYYTKDNKKVDTFIKCFFIGVAYMCARIIVYLPFVGGFKYGLADVATRAATGLQFNSAAQVAAFAIIFQYFFYIKSGYRGYFFLIALEMIVIYVTGSRKSIFIPIIGILLIVEFDYKKNAFKWFKALGIMFALLSGILIITKVNETFKNRMLSLFMSMFSSTKTDGSYMVRMYLIQKAVDMFKKRPIFGWGLNNFSYYSYKNMTNIDIYGRYAHNNYMEIISCLGIIGLVLYYIRYIIVILETFKRRKIPEAKICLAIFMTLALFEYGIISYYTVHLQIMLTLAFALFHEGIIENRRNTTYAKQ